MRPQCSMLMINVHQYLTWYLAIKLAPHKRAVLAKSIYSKIQQKSTQFRKIAQRKNSNSHKQLSWQLNIGSLRKSTRYWRTLRPHSILNTIFVAMCHISLFSQIHFKLECGPMPKVMAAMPNIGGALCSTPQSGRCPLQMVVWSSGRASVFGRCPFAVLRSTCSWWVTTYVGKPSAVSQPTRPTQPFILSGSINE